MENKVIAYTDGGSNNNPGEAGWAFFVEGEIQCNGYGGIASNNEMELQAMIECLKYLGKDRKALIKCDSTYVVKGLTEWIVGWIRRDWYTSSGTPVSNQELWKELYDLYNPDNHELEFVKGHSGVYGNELCDRLVQEAKSEKFERREVKLNNYVSKSHLLNDNLQKLKRIKKSLPNLSDSEMKILKKEIDSISTCIYKKVYKRYIPE